MKKLANVAVLSVLGLMSASGDVWAGATANANQCVPLVGTTLQFGSNGIINSGSDPIIVSCPVHVDHLLGASVLFRVRAFDNSSASNISCTGFANNQDAGTVGTSGAMNTSGTPGAVTLTSSATVSPQSSSNIYFVNCTIPGGGSSGINTVRVQ